jgi:hypothetical protein
VSAGRHSDQLRVERGDLDKADRILGAGLLRPELELVAEPDGTLGAVRDRRGVAPLLGLEFMYKTRVKLSVNINIFNCCL